LEVRKLKILLSTMFGVSFALISIDLSRTVSAWSLSPVLVQGSSPGFTGQIKAMFLKITKSLRCFGRKDIRWDEIASSLAFQVRAGKTLVDAIKGVAREGSSPGHEMLDRAYRLYESGVPIFRALETVSGGRGEPAMIAGVLEIGSVSGGDMPALLWHVFEILRKRRMFQGEVNARLSETRITALILSVMPWAVGIFTFRNNPVMFHMFFDSHQGKKLLIFALALWAMGNVLVVASLRSLVPRGSIWAGSSRGKSSNDKGGVKSGIEY
jgi:hypothetical protein